MTKFKVGPSVRAATIPTGTGFGAFGGMDRHCIKFARAKGGVYRCAEFKEGRGEPVCVTGLRDGGRSPGLVRKKGKCKGGVPAPKKAVAKKAPAKKKPARKPKK